MPHYFFNIQGAALLEDKEGVALHDADEARLHAVAFAGAWIAERPYLLSEYRDLRVEVHDEHGAFVSLVTIFLTNDPARKLDAWVRRDGGRRP